MGARICPECDTKTEADVCPECGSRTLRERREVEVRDPLLGKVLEGRYRIEKVVGRGGMGTVYQGVQLATKQVVAIKVIRAENAADPEAAKRFHREARAASQLTHPHTIRVFDFGESEDGDLFMVLEFLAGRPLSTVIQADGPLPEARIAKIGGEIAQSLSEASGRGLAHRDLKPDNVMLLDSFGDQDFVKVLDFGIAKFLSGSSGESNVTRTGAVVGTPHYMAPEQARGSRGLTSAVDVYALGIILFEAVTGVKPFEGESAVDILMKHVREPMPEIPAEYPVTDAFRALVRRLVAKDPAARPQATEVAESLERIRMTAVMKGSPQPAIHPTRRGSPVPVPRQDPVPTATPMPVDLAVAFAQASTLMGSGTRPAPSPTPAHVTNPPAASRAPRARTGWWIRWVIGGVAAAAMGAALGWVTAHRNDLAGHEPPAIVSPAAPVAAVAAPTPAAPPTAVPAPPPETAPAPAEPAPGVAPDAKPASPVAAPLSVRFASSPPGAKVYDGARELGTTPFEIVLAGDPGSRTFAFRLERYKDATVVADVAPGAVVTGRLERKPAIPPARPRPAPPAAGYRPMD